MPNISTGGVLPVWAKAVAGSRRIYEVLRSQVWSVFISVGYCNWCNIVVLARTGPDSSRWTAVLVDLRSLGTD
jgi:hypothetical protein